MDVASNCIYSAFFVEEEGTMSSFQGLIDVIETHGLFCALYAGRGMHYWHTPEAGGKVNKENLTQVERALKQLGTDLIPAYSPQAAGPLRAYVWDVSGVVVTGTAVPGDHGYRQGYSVFAGCTPNFWVLRNSI